MLLDNNGGLRFGHDYSDTIGKGAYDKFTNAFYNSALKVKNDGPERKEAASDLNSISSAQTW